MQRRSVAGPSGAQVSFDIDIRDAKLVTKIVTRAKKLLKARNPGSKIDTLCMRMDLIATHANGTPLDFKKFLEFDEFNFLHDLNGIAVHIDRSTGKLKHHFLPRSHK